jgi:hypothetical protein
LSDYFCHTNYKDYEDQDKKLELHLDILNEEIRKVNGSGDISPRCMQDMWRGSKANIVVRLFFAQLMQSWIFHPFFHIDFTFRQCSVITSLSMYLPLLSAKMTAFRIARRFSTSIGII